MDVPSGILEHIRHAEGWLRRARADCARGDARQVVLRLLLAEAEIRRARESGTSAAAPALPARRPRSVWMGVGAAVAAGLLVLAGYAMVRPLVSTPTASAPQLVHAIPAAQGGRGILRFESGGVLPLVGFPGAPQDRTTVPGSFAGVNDLRGGDPLDLPLRIGDDGPVPVTSK